jgi:hypothetical protein
VDVEGAELGVVQALRPIMPRIHNMIIEVSPAWWNVTHPMDRAGARLVGERQIGSLLSDAGGFRAARTSSGCTFTEAHQLEAYLHNKQGQPLYYTHGQMDLWLAKDASLLVWASRRVAGFLGRPGMRIPASRRDRHCMPSNYWDPPMRVRSARV